MPSTALEARRKLAGHTIWLWHYLHADWQWEQSRAWHEDRYVFAVNEALDLMQQHPEIKYYFDTASEFFEPIARKLAPRMDEIRQHVRDGRIHIVSAQVANCRPTQVADETFIRNLQVGRAYFEQTLPPTDLSLFHSVDIAVGHTQLPQILNLAGFKYYKAWRPHGPMNAHGIPHQFIWEGLDGSKILVTRGPYGGFYLKSHMPDDYAEHWDDAVTHIYDHLFHDQLLRDRSASRQLWMIQGCDDARLFRIWEGDQPIDLIGFVQTWREREATPIRWCTPLEYCHAMAEHADDLPTWRGVLDGCDVGYNTATNGAHGLWVWRQMNDRRLLRAEWWATAAASADFSVPQETWQHLWQQHLVYQAHAQDHGFADDFAALVDLAQEVRIESERIQRNALIAIAQAAGGGDRTVQFVFNPHPWPVEAEVELYHPCATADVESLVVSDGVGVPLPHQLLRDFRHPRYAGKVNDQRLLARIALPPMGYRKIKIVESPHPTIGSHAPPASDVVETAGLKLTFRDYMLREVRDTQSNAVYYARDGASWPRLVFHVLDNQDWIMAGPEVRRDTFAPHTSEWLHTGPLRWMHRVQGTLGPYQAQIDTTIADQRRELHIRVRLEGHWQKPPQTGFVTLLTDIDAGGEITVDVPFGVEPRDPDHEPYVNNPPQGDDWGDLAMLERLRPGLFWGRSWANWSSNHRGITWISTDGNYYWLKEPGVIGHVLLRACALLPNTWEEFCPTTITGSGVHIFNYAILFHDGDWRRADPQRRSAELRHPVVAVRPNHPAPAMLPDQEHSFLRLDGPALLSAYYRHEDENVVRIYESEGAGGVATLTTDQSLASAQAIDLLGQPIDVPISIQDKTISVNLTPWQIVTLKLKLENQ